MRSLSILHTVEFYSPRIGGAEKVVQGISEELVARGHRVTVATTKVPERSFRSLNGVEIVDFDVSGNLAKGFKGSEISRYLSFLQNFPCDVMMNYAAQQWATDLAFHQLNRRESARVNILAPCGYSALSDPQTLGVMCYGTYFEKILPGILPMYDAAIYHSASYKDNGYAQRLGLTNGVIIPNFVDGAEFQAESGIDFEKKYGVSTPFFILSVGNFLENKGQDKVIDAFKELGREDTTLVLIGQDGGALAKLRERAKGLNVKFLTDVPRKDTVAAFKSADLFMFGSSVEVSPLVIIEAKAARLPFVSTDCGNIKEFSGGIVCHASEMAMNAGKLLDNPLLRQDLGFKGWREFDARLTLKVVGDLYEKLYCDLVEAKMPLSSVA